MDIYCTFDYTGGSEESRSLLRQVLSYYQAEDLIDRIEISENGKPSIPGWYHFSISHTENCWAILIDEEPCGLDIQYARKCKYDNISERWFSVEDSRAIEEEPELFWKVWTRREACVKAIAKTVFDEVPSVLADTIELNGEEWNIADIELIGADEIPYGAICTTHFAKTINYYKI